MLFSGSFFSSFSFSSAPFSPSSALLLSFFEANVFSSCFSSASRLCVCLTFPFASSCFSPVSLKISPVRFFSSSGSVFFSAFFSAFSSFVKDASCASVSRSSPLYSSSFFFNSPSCFFTSSISFSIACCFSCACASFSSPPAAAILGEKIFCSRSFSFCRFAIHSCPV